MPLSSYVPGESQGIVKSYLFFCGMIISHVCVCVNACVYVFVCVHARVHRCIWHKVCVEIRGQLGCQFSLCFEEVSCLLKYIPG